MARPVVNSCCGCMTLKAGTIFTGICGIILSIINIVVIFTVRADFKTILLDWLPSSVVKIILTVNLCMTILICLLLIIGAMKRNHYLMLPWVVLGIVLAVGLLISVIYTAVVHLMEDRIWFGVVFLIIGLIFFFIYVYLWIVVFSYFNVLKEESERGRYSKQPYRR